MNCPMCGKAVPDGADRCPSCAAADAIAPGRAPAASPAVGAAAAATRAGAPPPGYDSFADGVAPPDVQVSAPPDLFLFPRGTLIAGRFEVLRMVGKGGMGAVYECKDRQLERQVAMKRLLPKLSGKEWGVQRFLLEAKAVAAISHQNVIQVHDIIDDPSGKYIVMEFVDGESLAGRLERGALPLREVTRIMLQIGMALDTVHRRGIVHRDIKPANILFTLAGVPKLGDFGIAQLFGQQDLTHTGTAMGTWVYASPEQLIDAKHVDHRSDIYSLGATMYEMLTGETPRHITEDKVPSALRTVVRKCLAKSPADRYQTAGEFVKGLTDAYNAGQRAEAATYVTRESAKEAGPQPGAAPQPSPPSPVSRPDTPGGAFLAAEGRRRRRSVWRTRGAPWSCPVQTAVGVGLLVWALANGDGVDAHVQRLFDYIRREVLFGNLTTVREGSVILTALTWLQRASWFWMAVVVGFCVGAVPVLRRVTTKYRLSASRLTVTEGLLLKHEHDFPLSDIQEVHVSQGILGRILGYGDIELARSLEGPILLQGVPRPSKVAEMIAAAKQQP